MSKILLFISFAHEYSKFCLKLKEMMSYENWTVLHKHKVKTLNFNFMDSKTKHN